MRCSLPRGVPARSSPVWLRDSCCSIWPDGIVSSWRDEVIIIAAHMNGATGQFMTVAVARCAINSTLAAVPACACVTMPSVTNKQTHHYVDNFFRSSMPSGTLLAAVATHVETEYRQSERRRFHSWRKYGQDAYIKSLASLRVRALPEGTGKS